MGKEHHYNVKIIWTGNNGQGTADYRSYDRSYNILNNDKMVISASSDPAFRGDETKYNPEELLLASLSGCHMLWFLHLCADNGIIVTDYSDAPAGIMIETENGGGRFSEVTLNPSVTVTDAGMLEKMDALHHKANDRCFIANSVNFPVYHHPVYRVENNQNLQ
jgi:organic hydroperoxide reductase OsmC/OhrA